MGVQVAQFQVSAAKHANASPDYLGWKVLIHVRFASDDPKNWGELRAYGGSWLRKINRTTVKTGVRSDNPQQLVRARPPVGDIEEAHLGRSKQLPFWGHGEVPASMAGEDVRLGNDQHIEIFYSRLVPNVRRSDPNAPVPTEHKQWECDPILDSMETDNPEQADTPWEIDSSYWHIIGRDEPARTGGFVPGDYVEYWHQAEFQIRVPNSMFVVERKRLFLRIVGRYPDYEYVQMPL